MNYAVILIPDFSLHALLRSDPSLLRKPVALIEGEGRKSIVSEVSAEARGAEPGQAVSVAMARCPGVLLKQRDPLANIEAQRLLLASAFSLSPRVEATAQHLCTVDLQGADEAHTETELRRQILALTKAGLPARGGVARTPLLATYAAQMAQPLLIIRDIAQFLGPLPLSTAEPTVQQATVLHGWGVHTLGDLTRLSKGDIGQRLGPDGAALWERAAGEAQRVLRLAQPRQVFVAEWAYDPPIETLEPLVFKLRRFAENIAFELRAASFVAEALALTLLLEDESDHRRSFRLPEPTTDVESWLRVLQSHLDTTKTEQRVVGVRLVATPARPPAKQDGLFDTGLVDAATFWENLARIGALIGDDRVGTPRVSNSHKADSFTLEKPAESIPPPGPLPLHPLRGLVLRRFRPPSPVRVFLTDDLPCEIDGAISGSVKDVAGPWHSAGDWWKPGAWAVERWHVELTAGGIYQLAKTSEGWAVEGVLD